MRRYPFVVLVGLVQSVFSVFVVTACADDKKTESPPEERRAPAAEVASGLRRLDRIAKDAAAATVSDKGKAKDLTDRLEPQWRKIEGTIKANDRDAYLSFEDNLALLKKAVDDGDAGTAAKSAAGIGTTASDYLGRYPG